MSPLQTTARNATLSDLRQILEDQQAAKVDTVVPASKMRSIGGDIHVTGAGAQITLDGVTSIDAVYRPTSVFDEGVASKLGIPIGYLRRMRETNVTLLDENINSWLDRDERSFLLRGFRQEGGTGIARSLHSDRYAVIDHLDTLVAALDGIRKAGVQVRVRRCDLTDRRMYVQVEAPEISMLAPDLLEGYRSPFTGASGTDNPVVFAGFGLENSETGYGRYVLKPMIVVQVCGNGATVDRDVIGRRHLGAQMEEGVIQWSRETADRVTSLVTSQTTDAVRTFLDIDYMRGVIAEMTQKAGVKVKTDDVRTVTKKLAVSAEVADDIFEMFVQGGQMTAGGVMQAVTASAQNQEDADLAHSMEDMALKALDLAASVRS